MSDGEESPYMMVVADVQKSSRCVDAAAGGIARGFEALTHPRSDIPAVTHVDYSARVQTVDRERNPRFHKLIQHFSDKTGCPLLINTSFNVRGEPIVATPADAWRCFMATDIDVLVMQ